MIQHQIVVKDVEEFQVTELWNESDDLSWFLLRLDEGSFLISSDFGYVELISEVSKEAVEEAVFTIPYYQKTHAHGLGVQAKRCY